MMIGIIWRRFKRNRLSVVGLTVILIIVSVAIAAPVVAPYDPFVIDVYNVISPPTSAHLLGTDDLGRDVLSRMIWGSRISLAVGFVAVGISTLIGIMLGALSGYYGGWLDRVVMRFIDIMLSIPTFFLILAVIAFIDPNIWDSPSIPFWVRKTLSLVLIDPNILN